MKRKKVYDPGWELVGKIEEWFRTKKLNDVDAMKEVVLYAHALYMGRRFLGRLFKVKWAFRKAWERVYPTRRGSYERFADTIEPFLKYFFESFFLEEGVSRADVTSGAHALASVIDGREWVFTGGWTEGFTRHFKGLSPRRRLSIIESLRSITDDHVLAFLLELMGVGKVPPDIGEIDYHLWLLRKKYPKQSGRKKK